ncbi:MAG: hypothetical protein MJ180_00205 [Candidatus Gastranaerophilales bacterium]|nr:hypothetical protein [Candidatus Gastranaerophilales bacterium]
MINFPTPQSTVFNIFKGIRTRNGIASNGTISATTCQNVDFVASSYDAGVQIKATLGNIVRGTYNSYTKLIKGFETVQEGTKYLLFYAESATKGALLLVTPNSSTYTVIQDNLTLTGEANGITMLNGAYDVFVFTNGKEYYSVQFYPETEVTKLEPQYEGDDITGLAMCEQDGSLVIGTEKGIVIGSRKGDITDWDYTTPTDTNKAWYQLFGKKVTAVVPYIDALLVFTENDSTMLSGNMSDVTTAIRADASLGGCMNYESWCKHDKYLFFYDNTQKNIYYYMQNNYGQKVLGEPIAPEIQKYFNNVRKFQMTSYIGNNRSEIWINTNEYNLIYDYFIGEWSERVCQNNLNGYFVYDNNLYSVIGNKYYLEKAGECCVFDNEYIGARYTTQIINLGSFSNMKEMEIQPLISVTQDANNSFNIDCEIDGKKVKTRRVNQFYQGAIWGDDSPQTADTPDNQIWDVQYWSSEDDNIIQQIKGKFISNWYYIRFTFRTEQRDDEFSITALELKGITQETDTTGRK